MIHRLDPNSTGEWFGRKDSQVVGWYVNDGKRRHDFTEEEAARRFWADNPDAVALGEWIEVERELPAFGARTSRHGHLLERRGA